MSKYKITITQIEEKTVTRKGDWTTIDQVPWDNELLKSENVYGNFESFLDKNPLKSVYGYAPSYQSTTKEETQVLDQTVSDIDLVAVIKAINNIK